MKGYLFIAFLSFVFFIHLFKKSNLMSNYEEEDESHDRKITVINILAIQPLVHHF